MVRPYAINGKKRKKRQEKYDREDDNDKDKGEEESAKRASVEQLTKELEEDECGADERVGIQIASTDQKPSKTGVIFVLEKACLEVARVGKSYQLLNSDDHANFLRKNKKNPADYRPDIVHQALLAILDSPVNKAGRLQALYVGTKKGVLFEVKPYVRIPRTYKRFSDIMLRLLQKRDVTAVGNCEKLLQVIENPITKYFPVNSRKIGFSYSSEKLVKMSKYVDAVGDDVNLVFVVGAMAHGKIKAEYTDDFIAISGYPLSAASCVARVTEALAERWNIV